MVNGNSLDGNVKLTMGKYTISDGGHELLSKHTVVGRVSAISTRQKMVKKFSVWYILAFGCSVIKSSIFIIYFRRYNSGYHITITVQLDQPGPLLFPADNRVLVTTLVTAQTFLTSIRSEYQQMIRSSVIAKASSLLFKKTDFHFSHGL